MKTSLFWLLLVLSILFEGTLSSFPLVLDLLIILYIYKKQAWVFTSALILGILLDILHVRAFGQTELFFLISLFLIFLYERKYEIETKEFVFFFTLLAGGVYFWYFTNQVPFFEILLNSALSVILFLFVLNLKKMRLHND